MKLNKLLLVGVITMGAITLTGCTDKESKLSCTQDVNGVTITFNVDFKGNVIESMNFSYDMDLSKYSDYQIEAVGKSDFCSKLKESMPDYKEAFINCGQNIEEKKLNVSAGLDIDKITGNVIGKMTSPEKGKSSLEESGYSCTLEN